MQAYTVRPERLTRHNRHFGLWRFSKRSLLVWLWVCTILGVISVATVLDRWISRFGITAEILAAATIIAAWAGIPQIRSIKVARHLRNLSRTIIRRRVGGTAAICASLVLVSLFAAVLWSSTARMYYSYLIRSSLDAGEEEKAGYFADAFVFSPWRREAAIGVERLIFLSRTDGDDRRFRFVHSFFDQPAIERFINTSKSEEPPFFLVGRNLRYYHEPHVWLASLILESAVTPTEYSRAMSRAAKLVEHCRGPEAQFFRAYLNIERGAIDIEPDRANIRKALESNGVSTDWRVIGKDVLGTENLLDKNLDGAWRDYAQILAILNESKVEVPLLRPPQKLVLFHLFQACDKVDDPGEGAKKVKEIKAYCPECFEAFKSHFCCESCRERKFIEGEAWKTGTVYGKEINELVTPLLTQGWLF